MTGTLSSDLKIQDLPPAQQEDLCHRFLSVAKRHFTSGEAAWNWCVKRQIFDHASARDLKETRVSQLYRALRQMVVELEHPDIARENEALRQTVGELQTENEILRTEIAVLSARLSALTATS